MSLPSGQCGSSYGQPSRWGGCQRQGRLRLDGAAAGSRRRHGACVAALLAAGADPTLTSPWGWDPLHAAARAGSQECVATLLGAGVDPLALDKGHWTPLHAAADAGHAGPVLRSLLAAAPEAALARDADGETPLAVAVREHYAATALALIREAPLPPAGEVLEALDWVVAPPCLQSTMWDLYPALAANHRLTAAEWARVPSPCHSIGPALPAVLERSPAEAALLALRHPCTYKDGRPSKLFASAEQGDMGTLEACLAAGMSANEQRAGQGGVESALHVAARAGHAGCVVALLAAGADPNAPNRFYESPLHEAASFGRLGCVAALLAGGARLEACSYYGFTPLFCAASANHTACVAALLAAGASPLAANARARALVHGAAERGATDALRLLLAAQPEAVLVKSRAGKLPLELTFPGRHLDAARCLLTDGALPPAAEALAALAGTGTWAQPLYATLAARQPLSALEWELVPAPCSGLGAALPAVLARSVDEAALLMRRLPPADVARMRAVALCASHFMPQSGLTLLPTAILWHLLALVAAG
ncbi:hypothetical protein ABPG77_002581 [Micractinium sp. CCAP 211/92]